jgi:hypothetical protein
MANEATIVELTNDTGFPRRFTIANGSAGTDIAIGTLMKISDPRTIEANGASEVGSYCAGILAMEKKGGDGSTSASVYTDGIFEMVASGSITTGHPVQSSDANKIEVATNAEIGSAVIGYALEDASDGETINVRISL